MTNETGTVFWVTGLAGAGKTTIARLLVKRLQEDGQATLLLDGDDLRAVFDHDLGHSAEDRLKTAFRISRLCRLVSGQGIHVVCATISMFREIRAWNREHLPSYREIYLKVPMEVLVQRDQNGLYSGALNGDNGQVIGLDLAYEEPGRSDVVVENDGRLSPDRVVDRILTALGLAVTGV